MDAGASRSRSGVRVARPTAPTGTRTVASDGYVRIKQPGHPYAVDGWVREHVLVLLDQLGPGTHPCSIATRSAVSA